jgi:outer membrane receptor for ferrienterochelin and colicin
MLTRKAAARVTLLAAPLASLLCRPVAVAAATPSDADNSPANTSNSPTAYSGNNALEEVTVLAQHTTANIARAAQFQAPNLINLTTADEMQKLPDVNTGEAIRRVPGISLETDWTRT